MKPAAIRAARPIPRSPGTSHTNTTSGSGNIRAGSSASTSQPSTRSVRYIRTRLNQLLREALGSAKYKHGIVLELFSGVGAVATAARNLGYAALAFDIRLDPHLFDLTSPIVLGVIRGWMRSKLILCVHFGTPCTTWSSACHPAVRKRGTHIFGFPDCPGHRIAGLLLGNSTLRATVSLLRLARRQQIPCSLENPLTSMLWDAPNLAVLLRARDCRVSVVHLCAYGARWRKPTKVAFWGASPHRLDERPRCRGRSGVCSFCGKRHIVLSGTDPVSHRRWTSLASKYPKRFASDLASTLLDAASLPLELNLYEILSKISPGACS